MPSALSAPTCGSTSWSGACITRTNSERNAKQTSIARTRVIAIFTTVHRKSSRCSRNGFDVSLSGNSRNLKMSRKAMSGSVRGQRNEAVDGESGTNSKCIGIANLILRDHSAQFRSGNRSTFENRLALLSLVHIGCLNRPGQEKIAMLVCQTRRSEQITERNQFAARRQVITGFLM